MKWFRMWTEARIDAKLRLLTDAEHRVWFNLLCFAAEQEPRGTINGVHRGKLAAEVARGRDDLLDRTITKLVKLHVLTAERDTLAFVHFPDRQYEFPSERPEAVAKRKRRMQAKA